MNYSHTIQPRDRFLDLRLKEVWSYRDLMMLFVQRDFVARYKQTILGPAWFFIQPIFTMIAFTFVFGNIAGLPTDGVPKSLFYLAGITSWNYFQSCLTTTSNTFTTNANLFGKVYFPRVVAPLSIIISNLIQFGIQIILFLVLYFYYLAVGAKIAPNATLLLFPVLVLIMGFMGLGLGMIISAMTTKYRDLQYLVQFGVQLLMYATPVIYPLSEIPQKYKWLIMANPMSGVVETFKYSFLSSGSFSWWLITYSGVFTLVVFFLGLLIFNKTEKNFMDTV
jgi:lipopolysaccharide transport system permease protein